MRIPIIFMGMHSDCSKEHFYSLRKFIHLSFYEPTLTDG